MYDARVIANVALARAEERGLNLTNLDLQKIVYFLHGHSLKQLGRPLVRGEFEAWQHGPVHKVLYDALRKFGEDPIEGRISAYDPIRRRLVELPGLDDSDALMLIQAVLDRYLDMPTWALVETTHAPGTPWRRTIEAARRTVNVGMRIGDDLIARHFEGRIEEAV